VLVELEEELLEEEQLLDHQLLEEELLEDPQCDAAAEAIRAKAFMFVK